jgi:hypothetical protein
MNRAGQRPGSTGAIVFGTALLIIGVLFLLRNAGLVSVEWSVIWPVIVIAIGLVIVLRAYRGPRRGEGDASVVIPPDGARRLELALRVGAGRFRLRGGSHALVEAAADGPSIDHKVERHGDLVRARLSSAAGSWMWGWRPGSDWRIGVASGVPLVLDVKGGAGEFDLDLSAVALASATLGIGAAELRVVLPRPRGDVPMRVEGGAASFTFLVPPGVEAKVVTSGLLSVSGPTQTPGYDIAPDRVTITVTGGAASVRLAPAA